MLSTDLAGLKAYMADNPGAVIEDVARERKVTPRAVLEALPDTMVRIGAGGEFGAAMNDVAQWGEVTLIVQPMMRSSNSPAACPRARSAAAIST